MDRETLFRNAIDANKDRLYRLCCSLLADEDARQDAYQEVLLNIWQGLGRFRGQSQLSTWVYRVAVNTCLMFRRTEHRRQRRFASSDEEQIGEIPDPPARSAIQDSQLRQLYAGITRLPDMDRVVISLYLEDVSTREMAEILGITEANARVKLHRVKKNLKQLVERSDGTE